ncbi:hypothetical protein PPYR_10313 [Photinus pyralis]|uniref:Uncharacterized protein n=1 Tax=Photinus pyralis TaxID=7054 RepID=A0A5N4AFY2_PHOPY|nr:uncharacterized protein LOC116174846 isoform X2 [Photinus pyralis]KAB0796252.1 hypothetical protein PPYR_10313 [Photinus pyralis]
MAEVNKKKRTDKQNLHRSRQLNPCDILYWKSRGFSERPHDWQARVYGVNKYHHHEEYHFQGNGWKMTRWDNRSCVPALSRAITQHYRHGGVFVYNVYIYNFRN